MTTVYVHNYGPSDVDVIDASGLAERLIPGGIQVFETPVSVKDAGSANADQGEADGGPTDETGNLPPSDDAPETEFETIADRPPITDADALADLDGRPRPDNPSPEATAAQQAELAAA
jgi:hypothetical protein